MSSAQGRLKMRFSGRTKKFRVWTKYRDGPRTAKWIAYQITYLIGNLLSALNTRPIAYPSRTELDSLSVSLSDRTTCAPPETGEHGEPLSHTHDRARRAHDTREHGGELNLRTAVGAG